MVKESSPRPPADQRKLALVLLFLGAAALRLVPAVWFPGLIHSDEIFQTVEQAHRLVFGYGAVPWEFEMGARSWLLPGLIAAPMWLGRLMGAGPALYLALIHGALVLLAATSVLCAYLWGERRFGVAGGVIAAALPALWPDAVYFGARTLSECVAAPVLVLALYLVEPGERVTARGRLFLAGFLLGLAVALRLQLAPAAALVLAWAALRAPRSRALPVLAGIAFMLGLAGALDAVTWHYPFQSMWLNFAYNTYLEVASSFGTRPWSFYGGLLLFYWGPVASLLLVALAAVGGWRFPLLLGAAIIILVSHSLVPHKEHRFIYPAILLLLIVAGLGAAQLAAWIAARRSLAPRGCAIVATSFFACCALALARSPAYAELWQSGQGMVRASYLISDLAAPCGVGIYKSLSGYAYFHQPVPFYWPDDQAELNHDLPAMDTLILGPGAEAPQGYRTLQCFDGTCVARRPGACEPIPMTAMPRPRAIATLAARKD